MKKNIITTWSTILLLLLYFGSAAQESPPLEQKTNHGLAKPKLASVQVAFNLLCWAFGQIYYRVLGFLVFHIRLIKLIAFRSQD